MLIILTFLSAGAFAQNGLDSWSIGAGASNSMMQGDLRSNFNVDALDAIDVNLGYYAYVDKMITPAFGFELKGRYGRMSGGAFELSNGYAVAGTTIPLGQTYFDATVYGAEFNTILNFSSFMRKPGATKARKWNFATYVGLGWHTHDSTLYDLNTDAVLVDYGASPSSDGHASSMYYTAAASLKYRLNANFDIEFRQDFNINDDDILDAARSTKQPFDMFMNTSLGVVYKLNNKNADNYVWMDKDTYDVEDKEVKEVNLFVDTDGDGVIDQFDKEPNTPRGAMVYGNGVAVDTDKDGFPDFSDPCPLQYSKFNNGCPKDSDNDGVMDDVDLCPNVAGDKARLGCPKETDEFTTTDDSIINIEPVYFELNSYFVTKDYFDLLTKTALTLFQNPTLQVRLEGHADVRGDDEYNQTLSENRVDAVQAALISRGVDASRIVLSTGYGENNPTFTSKKFHSYNRRVDIVFVK